MRFCVELQLHKVSLFPWELRDFNPMVLASFCSNSKYIPDPTYDGFKNLLLI